MDGSGKRKRAPGPSVVPSSGPLFDPLPDRVRDQAGVAQVEDGQLVVKRVLTQLLTEGTPGRADVESVIASKITARHIMLDVQKTACQSDDAGRVTSLAERAADKRSAWKVNRTEKVLPARVRRELKLFDLADTTAMYEQYLPLAALWNEYIAQIVSKNPNPAVLLPKLLKADLHGCTVTVVQSRAPSLVGVTGIVLMETANTFKVVTTANAFKTVPKTGVVFELVAGSQVITLYGTQLCQRSAERTSRRYHGKATVAL